MVKTIVMSNTELQRLYEYYENISYDKKYGPQIDDETAERDKKANCQRFVRDAIEAHFGVRLPATFLSQEIYHCLEGLFDRIEFGEETAGDIFLLGPDIDESRMNPKGLHLTFFEGDYAGENDPYLRHFHGNAKKTGLKNYALSVFQDEIHRNDYGKVWGIRRIVPQQINSIDTSQLPTLDSVEEYFLAHTEE